MTPQNSRKGTKGRPARSADAGETEIDIFKEALKRWADMPPVTIVMEMPRSTVLSLIAAFQILARQEEHPNTDLCRDIIEIGRGLQAAMCDTPELYLIVDEGWPKTHDEGHNRATPKK